MKKGVRDFFDFWFFLDFLIDFLIWHFFVFFVDLFLVLYPSCWEILHEIAFSLSTADICQPSKSASGNDCLIKNWKIKHLSLKARANYSTKSIKLASLMVSLMHLSWPSNTIRLMKFDGEQSFHQTKLELIKPNFKI